MAARLLPLALLFLALPALAQPRTPGAGSAERRAILDAARATVATHPAVRGAFVFSVQSLRVEGAFAFLHALPTRPGGQPLAELDAYCPDADVDVFVLLQRRGGRWATVNWGTCATDAFYAEWPTLYDVPPALLGMEGAPPPVGWWARVVAPDGSDPWLALRSEPSVRTGTRLARMPHDARVEVLACTGAAASLGGRSGSWCRVRFGRQSGWAFDAYLRAE